VCEAVSAPVSGKSAASAAKPSRVKAQLADFLLPPSPQTLRERRKMCTLAPGLCRLSQLVIDDTMPICLFREGAKRCISCQLTRRQPPESHSLQDLTEDVLLQEGFNVPQVQAFLALVATLLPKSDVNLQGILVVQLSLIKLNFVAKPIVAPRLNRNFIEFEFFVLQSHHRHPKSVWRVEHTKRLRPRPTRMHMMTTWVALGAFEVLAN
jgi:hypothetical protein